VLIRTPWLALWSVVNAFRRLHGREAGLIGFPEVWIAGANESFTERLDIDGSTSLSCRAPKRASVFF